MSAILKIPLPDLQGQPSQPLTSAVLAAATSLPLPNTGGYVASKYLLIGGHGSPVSEIQLGGAISSVTALAVAALSFPHSAGEIVQQIPYNQVEITYSTDFETLWNTNLYADIDAAAAAASWSTLGTYDLVPSQEFTTKKDDSTSSRTYRWRYKNSTDTIYSDYMNYQFPDGFEEKSLAAIFRKATNFLNQSIDPTESGQVQYEFLFGEMNQCARNIGGERKRWSHDAGYSGTLGDIVAGKNGYVLPNNIETRDTKESIWNVKINDQWNLDYIDKREMDALNIGVHSTTLTVALTSASSSATVADSSNLESTGSISVWVDGVQMSVTYTANNKSTNVLTTPNTATEVTATAAIGTQVWQNANFGIPSKFTVYNGKIYFDVVPNATVHARTIGADYYVKIQQFTSLKDYVREKDPNLYIDWLKWAILSKSNNSSEASNYRNTQKTGFYDQGLMALEKAEYSGQKHYLRPRTRRSMYQPFRRRRNPYDSATW